MDVKINTFKVISKDYLHKFSYIVPVVQEIKKDER